jgi:hypothetical protein
MSMNITAGNLQMFHYELFPTLEFFLVSSNRFVRWFYFQVSNNGYSFHLVIYIQVVVVKHVVHYFYNGEV